MMFEQDEKEKEKKVDCIRVEKERKSPAVCPYSYFLSYPKVVASDRTQCSIFVYLHKYSSMDSEHSKKKKGVNV